MFHIFVNFHYGIKFLKSKCFGDITVYKYLTKLARIGGSLLSCPCPTEASRKTRDSWPGVTMSQVNPSLGVSVDVTTPLQGVCVTMPQHGTALWHSLKRTVINKLAGTVGSCGWLLHIQLGFLLRKSWYTVNFYTTNTVIYQHSLSTEYFNPLSPRTPCWL